MAGGVLSEAHTLRGENDDETESLRQATLKCNL